MGPGKKNHIISISQIINLTNQINLQVRADWLDGAEDARRYDFMVVAVRLETRRILLPGYDC